MTAALDAAAFNQLFLEARTHTEWLPKDVPDDLLRRLVDVLKMGPTSANSSPARFLFVKSPDAKSKLKPLLDPGNVEKTMSAPVVAIIASDPKFYEYMPKLFPHVDARSWFAGDANKAKADVTAFRNGTLQGAYLIVAARALGLDCGPMSGFDNAGVDAAFFAETGWKSNFLCNLGYGNAAALKPRSPRFAFDEIARII